MKKIYKFIIIIIICLFGAKISNNSREEIVEPETAYLISTPDDLLNFANSVNSGNTYNGKYIKQICDIDLKDIDWPTIGLYDLDYSFEGIYDGGGHVIKNLSAKVGGNNALFGKLGGTVMNLGIENGEVIGACVGAITSHASNSSAIIINCYNKASVSGARAGGIADNFIGSIINCWTDCDLKSESIDNIGGIVSYDANSVINCYSFRDGGTTSKKNGEIIDLQNNTVNLQKIVDKLNKELFYSAKISGVDYHNLYFWEVSKDGKTIVFTNEKASIKNKYLMQYIITWLDMNFSYIFIGVGVCMFVYVFSKSKEKEI